LRSPRRYRRALADPHLVDAAGKPVLLDQRLGVTAEIGGHRGAVALGQEPLSEEDDDRHRAREQGDADKRELEEAETADAGIASGFGDEHVHRRAGQREHRAGMGGEDQRHQELRGVALEADGDDHHHRQQGRYRAVDADQRGEQRNQQHGQKQKSRPAFLASSTDEKLAGPGGDAGDLEAGADDEERGDEDDGGIAEAAERLTEGQHACRPERQSCQHRDDDDRDPVRDEQDDGNSDDGRSISYRAQSLSSSLGHAKAARSSKVHVAAPVAKSRRRRVRTYSRPRYANARRHA
jgi:hypothetical protein